MFLIAKINKIEEQKAKLNLSDNAISIKAGLPNNSLGRILRGDTKKTHHLRAEVIAKALECKVSDLFEEAS